MSNEETIPTEENIRQHTKVIQFEVENTSLEEAPCIQQDLHDNKIMIEKLFQQTHERLGHISPKRIMHMAKQGILDPRLAKCRIPMCVACQYGKATKKPWRSKFDTKTIIKNKAYKLEELVYIDQLVSSTPVLLELIYIRK